MCSGRLVFSTSKKTARRRAGSGRSGSGGSARPANSGSGVERTMSVPPSEVSTAAAGGSTIDAAACSTRWPRDRFRDRAGESRRRAGARLPGARRPFGTEVFFDVTGALRVVGSTPKGPPRPSRSPGGSGSEGRTRRDPARSSGLPGTVRTRLDQRSPPAAYQNHPTGLALLGVCWHNARRGGLLMHLGMAVVFQNPGKARSDREVYRNELRLADLAEPLGFQS